MGIVDIKNVRYDYGKLIVTGIENSLISELIKKLELAIEDIYDFLEYKDIYIGAGTTPSDIAVEANHYDTVQKGKLISITSASEYLWVILSERYQNLAVMMGGISIPMSLYTTISINGMDYNVYRSNNAYIGTFDILMF